MAVTDARSAGAFIRVIEVQVGDLMIREIYYFFRHGPRIQKTQQILGPVEFLKQMSKDLDADGLAGYRRNLVGDLGGDILEVGTGTGATFPYYEPGARVTAVEPDDDYRAAAEEATRGVAADIRVLSGVGEELPFEDASFDFVSASMVLCSVASPSKTLEEFKRVLRPGGQIRLMEHVRSEHWLAGPLMNLFNPLWLRVNKVGCNWNRRTVDDVRNSGFVIRSLKPFKIYSPAAPAALPCRVIKADRPA
ncbi:MAG: class I SAM-dependent methyltransferase [Gammaproteobacteria bacterium]